MLPLSDLVSNTRLQADISTTTSDWAASNLNLAQSFPVIDSHIHLWPASGSPFGRGYGIQDYLATSAGVDVPGFVFIETNRQVGTQADVTQAAKQPLDEIKFLRRIVEGHPQDGDRFVANHSRLLLGMVPWAPIDRGVKGFEEYMIEAEKAAGPLAWTRVKGFRYLLQSIRTKDQFSSLVLSDPVVEILRSFTAKGRNFIFEVGVDQRSGGVWQLETAADMIQKVRAGVEEAKKVTFILDHLCKPDFRHKNDTAQTKDAFIRYRGAMERFSKESKLYIKLSGAFSELDTQVLTLPKEKIVENMRPWLDVIFSVFPPERIMFGSDWPISTMSGLGDKAWKTWHDVVELVLEVYKVSEDGKARIWHGTAIEAYRLELSLSL